MKKSINAWSIPEAVSFEDLFQQVSAAGFEAIELNIDRPDASAHSLSMNSDQQLFDRINALVVQYRLPVCSISTSLYGTNCIGSNLPAEREQGKSLLRKQLDCAKALGADAILVVPGGNSADVSLSQAYLNCALSLTEMKPEIEQSGIQAGLENVWNGFFLSPLDMCTFIDRLECPAICAYFDVGNVAVHSHPEHWIEILGRRICKIHVKDFKRSPSWFSGHFVNLMEGDINWPKVIRALKAVGYEGYLTAEVEPIRQKPELLYHMTAEALTYIIGLA